MDDSWRMRMAMPSVPARRSSGADRASCSAFPTYSEVATNLQVDDFADVFGGPPRSVLPRQSSGGASFFDEIFRPDFVSKSEKNNGRNLPEFRIPVRSNQEGFYSDIFGSDDEFQRRSRERSRPNSKAKSNSSSVLSSEELSPLRPIVGDDVALLSLASKLRPLNVRWDSSTMKPAMKKQDLPAAAGFHFNEDKSKENDYDEEDIKASYFGFTRKANLSPETISIELPSSFQSVKLSRENLEPLNSPASDVSSICQEHDAVKDILRDHVLPRKEVVVVQEQEQEQEEVNDENDENDDNDDNVESEDDDYDEVMSSYVIEINSDHRESTCEEVNLEEAIAWAKEKFQTHGASENEASMMTAAHDDTEEFIEMEEGKPKLDEYADQQINKHEMIRTPEMELELLDEDIRLWSAGKESNIRMLLSTLHQILWPNSGWYTIPLTSLIESSQVKKAYQKARLCLHPDKLQQRSATPHQKYVAQKAFSILQDAWEVFISHDVFII